MEVGRGAQQGQEGEGGAVRGEEEGGGKMGGQDRKGRGERLRVVVWLERAREGRWRTHGLEDKANASAAEQAAVDAGEKGVE